MATLNVLGFNEREGNVMRGGTTNCRKKLDK